MCNEDDDVFKLNLRLLEWWCPLHYRQNNSQKQFEHREFNAKRLKIFSKNPEQNSETLYLKKAIFLGYVKLKFNPFGAEFA